MTRLASTGKNTSLRRSIPRTQRGQATIEFVVLALVLVPILIAIPLLGKYIDVNQATEQASRYVAFEAAARNTSNAWKTDTELGVEVRRRFFSNSDAPVKTGDVPGNFMAHRNPLWTNHSGKALIEKFETDVTVDSQRDGYNAIAATAVYRDQLKLSDTNLYTGQVTVKFANIANFAPFDVINLSTTRKTVLLADAWTANDNGQIKGKITGSLAMYPIGRLKSIVDTMGRLPTVVYDPALKVNAFDWDVVPCDRLIGGC